MQVELSLGRLLVVDAGDLELRRGTYAQFVALGRAPTREETAQLLHLSAENVLDGWRRLHEAHALVLPNSVSARATTAVVPDMRVAARSALFSGAT